jgi:hypothetical protein
MAEKYNSLELANLISLVRSIDRSRLMRVYHLGSINEKDTIFERIQNCITKENHLCISLLRKGSPFSFNKLDKEGIVESVEVFYEIYLILSDSKLFQYCVVRVDMFPDNGKLTRELALFHQVKPFFFQIYFTKRRLIYNRDL